MFIMSAQFKRLSGSPISVVGLDMNVQVAFSGDSGTEYVTAFISPATEYAWLTSASSADCPFMESFDCVEEFAKDGFMGKSVFKDNNRWKAKAFMTKDLSTVYLVAMRNKNLPSSVSRPWSQLTMKERL